jgi:SAM-dependent methyltransferase
VGSFDVAHARFVLEHVRDPGLVVRNMVRAVRPGGRIILADDDYETLRLWPELAGLAAVWRAYRRTYDRHGNDPCIGRRLVQLLHHAGAGPTGNTFVFFGSCAGQADFAGFVANLVVVVLEARDDIAATGVAPAAVDALVDELGRWQRRPDAALWYGIFWAEGARPS